MLGTVLFGSAAYAQNDAATDLSMKILPSLVKIVSICGNNEARVATGFVWGPHGSVVTDLHVVAGCPPPYTVLYFQTNGSKLTQIARDATVSRVLRAADLVLLTVTNPPDAPPLRLSPTPVKPEQWVEAWGFPLGVQAPINTRLQVTFANDLFPELSSTLDDAARSELQTLKFPDLSAQVLHLSGPLQPGDSGAPVLDQSGEVVGIGSGGLQQGASSISWAMRAQYLANLENSSDPLPAGGDASAMFAYATSAANVTGPQIGGPAPALAGPDSVQCGALTLIDRGTRPLSQLWVPGRGHKRIQAMERRFGVPGEALSSQPFRIWTEPRSGASIIVPAEAKLTPDGEYCRAEVVAGAGVGLTVRLGVLPDDPATPEWQLAVSVEDERGFRDLVHLYKTGLWWQPEDAWSLHTIQNGARVEDRAMWNKRDLRVYRTDMFGRGVNVNAAVAEPSASAASKLQLLRFLTGLTLSGFPPRDQTAPSDADMDSDAPSVSAQNDDAAEPLPVTQGPRLYPIRSCGTPFLMMTPVPTFGALAATDADLASLAKATEDLAKLGPDDIRTAQYEVWGQPWSGTTVLLPRGIEPVEDDVHSEAQPGAQAGREAAELADKACVFTLHNSPRFRFVLLGTLAKGLPDPKQDLSKIFAQRLRVQLQDWQPLSAERDGNLAMHRYEGTGSDDQGRPVKVFAVTQTQFRWTTVAAAIAPAETGTQGPAPRLGAALAGLFLGSVPLQRPAQP